MAATEEEYLKFLKCCEKNLTGSNKQLISLIKKRYNECSKKYKHSKELHHLLSSTRKKMQDDSKHLFVHLKDCLNELKAYSSDEKEVKRKRASDESFDSNSKRSKLSNGRDATITHPLSQTDMEDLEIDGEACPKGNLAERFKITGTAALRTTSSLESVISNLKGHNILGKSDSGTDKDISEKVKSDKKELNLEDDDDDDDDDCILIEDTQPVVFIDLDGDDDDTELEAKGLTSDKTKSEDKGVLTAKKILGTIKETGLVNKLEGNCIELVDKDKEFNVQEKDVKVGEKDEVKDQDDEIKVSDVVEMQDDEVKVENDMVEVQGNEVKVQDDDDIFEEMVVDDSDTTGPVPEKEAKLCDMKDKEIVQIAKNGELYSDSDKNRDIVEKKAPFVVESIELKTPIPKLDQIKSTGTYSREHIQKDSDEKISCDIGELSTGTTKDPCQVSKKTSRLQYGKDDFHTTFSDTYDVCGDVPFKVDKSDDLITLENSGPSPISPIILDTTTEADALTMQEISSKEFFANALNLSGVGLSPRTNLKETPQAPSTSASASYGSTSPSSHGPRQTSASSADWRESKESKKKEVSSKHIGRLEKLLEKLRDKINKIQEKELSLDDLDEEDSSYIYEDKLKKKFVAAWNKLCQLKERAPTTGRPTERRFTFEGTRYPEINKKIEKLINRKKIFPDFHDIKRLITKVNMSHKLHLSKQSVESLAREAFTDVGNTLQRRRHEDFITTFGCTLTDKTDDGRDPAQFDADLRNKLEQNRNAGKAKLEQVLKKFSDLQYSKGEEAEEVPEGSDTEKSVGEEEEEEEEDDNDVITVTVEDLSSDNEDVGDMKSLNHPKSSCTPPPADLSTQSDSTKAIQPRPMSKQDSPNIIQPRPAVKRELPATDPVLVDDSESPERELSLETSSPGVVCADSPVVIASESPVKCQDHNKSLETTFLDDTGPEVAAAQSSTLVNNDLSNVEVSEVDDPPEPVEVDEVGDVLLSPEDPSLPELSTSSDAQEDCGTSSSTPNAASTPVATSTPVAASTSVATEPGQSSPSQGKKTKLSPSVKDSTESLKDLSKSDSLSHKRLKWLAPMDGESLEEWQKSNSDSKEKTQILSPVVCIPQKEPDINIPTCTEPVSGTTQHSSPHKSPSIEIVEDTPESMPSETDIASTMETPAKEASPSPKPSSGDADTSSPLTIQPRYATRESSPSFIEIVDSVLSSDEECEMEDDLVVTWTKHSDKSSSTVDPEVMRRSIFIPPNQEKSLEPDRLRTNTHVPRKGGTKSLSLNRSFSSNVQYSQTQAPSVSSPISSSYQTNSNKKSLPLKNYTVSNSGNQSLSGPKHVSKLNYKVHSGKDKVMFLDHKQLSQQNRNYQKTTPQNRPQSSYFQNSPNRRDVSHNHQLSPQNRRNISQNHQLSPEKRVEASLYRNLSPQLRRDLTQLKQSNPQGNGQRIQQTGAMQKLSFSPQKTIDNRASLQRQQNRPINNQAQGNYVANRSSFGPTGVRSVNGWTSNKPGLSRNSAMASINRTNLHHNRNQLSLQKKPNKLIGASQTRQAAQNNYLSFAGQRRKDNVFQQESRSPAAGQGNQFSHIQQTSNQRLTSASPSDQNSLNSQGVRQRSSGTPQSSLKQRSKSPGGGYMQQKSQYPMTINRSRSPGTAQLSPGGQASRLVDNLGLSPGNQSSKSPGFSSLQRSPGSQVPYPMKQRSCSPGKAGYKPSPGKTTNEVKQRSRPPASSQEQSEGQMSAVKQAVEMSSQCYIDIDEGDDSCTYVDESGGYGEDMGNKEDGQEECGFDAGKAEDVVVLSDSD